MAQSVNISIPLFGTARLDIYVDPRDQQAAERFLKNQPAVLNRAYLGAATEFGNKLLKIIKRCIMTGKPPPNQGVSWPPHSEWTKKRFGEHPLLNLTGQYYREVQLMKSKYGRVMVGVPKVIKERMVSKKNGGVTADSTRTLNQIAYILEVGTANIPPRPLWKPAYQAAGGPKEIRNLMVKHIRREISKEIGGIRNARLPNR